MRTVDEFDIERRIDDFLRDHLAPAVEVECPSCQMMFNLSADNLTEDGNFICPHCGAIAVLVWRVSDEA